MKKSILSGNEAIARGALDAGIALATAYPGTPSTEILETIARLGGTRTMWAPNEKIAVELASGVSIGGRRTLAAMKHVGVNVAADPLFTQAYTGVRGGFVIVTADDPELHSSQNEQDNRRYETFARIPMLEPADSQESLEYTRLAFSLSERFDLPIFLRTTTRISHGKSIVEITPWEEELPTRDETVPERLEKDKAKFVMAPTYARVKHVDLEERIERMTEFAESTDLNRIEMRSTEMGIVTSGVSYNYVREAAPEASVLKLGLVFPMPVKLLKDFAGRCDRVVVVEELEPHIEEWLKYNGIECEGKSILPRCGELNSGIVRRALFPDGVDDQAAFQVPAGIPERPPIMCIGCPHRGIFHLLSRKKTFVAGDIGCYTLAVTPPLSAIHTTLCMGAGVNQGAGIETVRPDQHGKVVSVIGDSTFLHSGMGGVLNMAYNNIPATVLILDNYTTAMTGRQNHPGSGFDVSGNRTRQVDWEALIRGLGIEHVVLVDAYDLAALGKALDEEVNRDAPSVIITQGACMLIKNRDVRIEDPYTNDHELCTDCGMCLKIGCPSISRGNASADEKPVIDTEQCTGCSYCFQVCKFDAIGKA